MHELTIWHVFELIWNTYRYLVCQMPLPNYLFSKFASLMLEPHGDTSLSKHFASCFAFTALLILDFKDLFYLSFLFEILISVLLARIFEIQSPTYSKDLFLSFWKRIAIMPQYISVIIQKGVCFYYQCIIFSKPLLCWIIEMLFKRRVSNLTDEHDMNSNMTEKWY